MINHILIEAVCTKEIDRNSSKPSPVFCVSKRKLPTYKCLASKCPYIDFTSCEDTLCYIGADSDEEYGISFGGDMEEGVSVVGVEEWKQIAISKVTEAYEQFMQLKNSSSLDVPK